MGSLARVWRFTRFGAPRFEGSSVAKNTKLDSSCTNSSLADFVSAKSPNSNLGRTLHRTLRFDDDNQCWNVPKVAPPKVFSIRPLSRRGRFSYGSRSMPIRTENLPNPGGVKGIADLGSSIRAGSGLTGESVGSSRAYSQAEASQPSATSVSVPTPHSGNGATGTAVPSKQKLRP